MDLKAVKDAAQRTAGKLHITPILSSVGAADALRRSGGPALGDGRVRFKSEHLQRSGSYKVRGMLNRVARLVEFFGIEDVKRRGIITFSAGNAAAAYAWAGRAYGIPVEVVMPAKAVPAKIAACKAYGATVHLVEGHMGTAGELKNKLVAERGLIDAHPFDDPFVIAGHGSIGVEILEQIPEADVVIGGLGGGGMLCGASVALRALKPEIRLYGVEPDGSSAVKQAVDTGGVVPVTPVTVADGLGAPYAGSWTLPPRHPPRRRDPRWLAIRHGAPQAGGGARRRRRSRRPPLWAHSRNSRGQGGHHPERRKRRSHPHPRIPGTRQTRPWRIDLDVWANGHLPFY
jgi:threonine dehydratase